MTSTLTILHRKENTAIDIAKRDRKILFNLFLFRDRARLLGIARPFVTYVAGGGPRKNLRGAVAILPPCPARQG